MKRISVSVVIGALALWVGYLLLPGDQSGSTEQVESTNAAPPNPQDAVPQSELHGDLLVASQTGVPVAERSSIESINERYDAAATDLPLSLLRSTAAAPARNGDALAAMQLYRRTRECEIERHNLEHITKLGTEAERQGDSEQGRAMAALRTMKEAAAVRTAELCDERVSLGETSLEWLRVAAANGDPWARQNYLRAVVEQLERDPTNAVLDPAGVQAMYRHGFGFLRESLAAGNYMALYEISNVYEHGIGVKRDPVRAAAYMQVLAQTGVLRAAPQANARLTSSLTPEQIAQSNELAAQIRNQCCR